MVWHNTSLGMDCFDRGVVTACNKSVKGDVITGLDYDTLDTLAAVDIAKDYDYSGISATKLIDKITIGEDTVQIGSNVSIAAVDDLKIYVDKIGAKVQGLVKHLGLELDEENNVIEKSRGRGIGRLRRSQLRTL